MRRIRCSKWIGVVTSLGVISTLISCSSSKPEQAPTASPAPAAGVTPTLWGDLKPIVSVKELMRDMIDPLADYIFDAVGTEVTKNGVADKVPKTDEDWDRIRTGGVSIAESAYLLKVRRPFAPAGDLNNSTGPDAVELSPDTIMAKVEKDPVEWNARIEALRNVGLEVIDIAKRKDVGELWDAGFNLDQACENCHKSYWYPGEDAKFYDKLNRRMEEYLKKTETEGTGKGPKAPTAAGKLPRGKN